MGARRRPLPPEIEARLRELHAGGACDPAIAGDLGVSGSTAHKWRQSLGLPANTPASSKRGTGARGYERAARGR